MKRIVFLAMPVISACAALWLNAGETPPKPSGWRNDGTGVYPDSVLPLTWDARKNALWETDVGWSFSSATACGDPAATPAVLGKRMFVRSGGYLVCIGEKQ